LVDKVPGEVWSSKKVKSFLCTFGRVTCAVIDPKKIDKLDPKSKKCYLLGCGTDLFGYMVWDGNKVFRHYVVVFDELVLYKDRLERVLLIYKW